MDSYCYSVCYPLSSDRQLEQKIRQLAPSLNDQRIIGAEGIEQRQQGLACAVIAERAVALDDRKQVRDRGCVIPAARLKIVRVVANLLRERCRVFLLGPCEEVGQAHPRLGAAVQRIGRGNLT